MPDAMFAMSTEIRAVCFDAVGTLIVPEPPAHQVYAAIGRKHGTRLQPDEIRQRFRQAFAAEEHYDLGHDLRTSEERELRRWQHIVAVVLDDAADPAASFAELYEHFAQPQAWRCQPHVAQVLRQLAGRYVLALASNYDHRLRRVVAGLPELAPLAHLIISSEVGWRKPAPAFFAAVCAALQLEPRAVLHVGDDPINDQHGASAVGMRSLLFCPEANDTPGAGCIRDLRELLC